MLKNNKLILFFTILFFLVAVSSLGYICYDNFKDDDKVDVKNKQNNGSIIKEEEELDINSRLVSRIDNGNITEVILALKPSIEGETTMQYIKKILENKNVKVSKIATGIPLGTDMEYIDTLTLELALEERKNIS